MLEDRFQRIDFEEAGRLIDREASPSDVVLDAYVFSPGPLSPLDIQLHGPHKVLRVDVPQARNKPFAPFDPVNTPEQIAHQTLMSTPPGGRVFIVTRPLGGGHFGPSVDEITRRLSPNFKRVQVKTYPGIYPLSVVVLHRTR